MLQSSEATLDVADCDALVRLFNGYARAVTGSSDIADRSASEVAAHDRLEVHLTLLSQRLARDASSRQRVTASGSLLSLLHCLSSFLNVYEQCQKARHPSDDFEQQKTRQTVDANQRQRNPYRQVCQIATLCMRVLRNAMAACPEAQKILCEHFDLVSPLLDNITRFHTLNDPDATLLARSAAQMLSNLVTANQDVQRQIWPRIVVPDSEQDALVLKLLSSPDTGTQSAAQILLINFLRTPAWSEDADKRCRDLCTSASGLRLIQSLLSNSESILIRTASASQDEASEGYEPESEIQGLEESLGFIYTIFAILFERGHGSKLVSALEPIGEISSTSSSSSSDLPIISSAQLTLLKLLDSWLHLQQKQVAEGQSSSTDELSGAGLVGLIDIFMDLSKFARSAMAGGIAKAGQPADQQPQDRRLIGVHHGLLLILQCLLSISMTADGWSDERRPSDHLFWQRPHGFARLSRALLSDLRADEAFVDELVALLDQTHQYAPALSPFRPSDPSGQGSTESTYTNTPLPEGHALSSTGKAAHEAKGAQPSYGFDHLKRDIVRVLGSLVYAPIQGASSTSALPNSSDFSAPSDGSAQASDLAFTRTQIRQVQDRIRERGGLFHVLNMTVLDERNPYMREHAIFALRYLLAGNTESQKLVGSLQPSQPDAGRGGMQMPMV